MMDTLRGERRTEPRTDLSRPCKLFDPRSGKYVAATTCNVSGQGLLIDVPREIPLRRGDRIYLGVAWKRREAVLERNLMLSAQVLRTSVTPDSHTLAALQLDEEIIPPLEQKRPYCRAA
jgi:hypothetical protein